MNALLLALVLLTARAHADTNSTTTADLGVYVENGKTNRIARIIEVKPTYIYVALDCNAGRKIPRNELPPELARQFPYDADKAAEFERNQAMKAAQQRAAEAAAARVTLEQKERSITAEIARLEEEERNLMNKQTINKSLTRGERRRNKVADNAAEREKIADRIAVLRKQLVTIRAQKDAMP